MTTEKLITWADAERFVARMFDNDRVLYLGSEGQIQTVDLPDQTTAKHEAAEAMLKAVEGSPEELAILKGYLHQEGKEALRLAEEAMNDPKLQAEVQELLRELPY